MERVHDSQISAQGNSRDEAADVSLPQLVGKIYEAAPVTERTRLLEHLLRPLGVLSLAVVANGIFSKLRFLGGWPDLQVRPEHAESVRSEDVIALVDYVQQASSDVMYGLIRVVSESPVMSATAGATLLITVLMGRARQRPRDADDSAL
jgi:hypothetical protein